MPGSQEATSFVCLGSPPATTAHIFPGAELSAVSEILASLTRVSRLSLHPARAIGRHYAQTLHHWRERFHRNLDEVRAQGFDERFIRMWDLYLGYCEAAFLGRHINDVQLLLTKDANRRALFGDPWRGSRESGQAILAPARAGSGEGRTWV